jgi:hypothetical protein
VPELIDVSEVSHFCIIFFIIVVTEFEEEKKFKSLQLAEATKAIALYRENLGLEFEPVYGMFTKTSFEIRGLSDWSIISVYNHQKTKCDLYLH